jgi:ribose transport system substrate-binding protein
MIMNTSIRPDRNQKAKRRLSQICEHDSVQREASEIIGSKGVKGLADAAASRLDRRSFMMAMSGAAATLGIMNVAGSNARAAEAQLPPIQYKAVHSSIGLSIFWTQAGAKTLVGLGRILGIDYKILDSKLDVDEQRRQMEGIASTAKEYDLVSIQPNAIGAFTEPCKRIIAAGVPLVDVDTRLTQNLDDLDVVCFTEPDNDYMGAAVTEQICAAINYEGGIVETQGLLTHTGAQGRHRGFESVVKKYPKITVLDQTPANWDPNRVREIWDNLLVKYGNKIKAGFFHNDDMALAAQSACTSGGFEAGAKGIFLGGVDAVKPALEEFQKGRLYATVANPPGRDHGFGLWCAYYHIARGEKAGSNPKYISCDGPLYSRGDPKIAEKVESGMWLSDHYLI